MVLSDDLVVKRRLAIKETASLKTGSGSVLNSDRLSEKQWFELWGDCDPCDPCMEVKVPQRVMGLWKMPDALKVVIQFLESYRGSRMKSSSLKSVFYVLFLESSALRRQ